MPIYGSIELGYRLVSHTETASRRIFYIILSVKIYMLIVVRNYYVYIELPALGQIIHKLSIGESGVGK